MPISRDEIANVLKLWGAAIALVSTLGGVAWGLGTWVLDRQSIAVAAEQHRALEAKIEAARLEEKQARQADFASMLSAQKLASDKLAADVAAMQRRVDDIYRELIRRNSNGVH